MEYKCNFDTLWSHAYVVAVVPSLRVFEGLLCVNVMHETGNVNSLILFIVYAECLLCAVQMSFSNVVSHKPPTRECLLKKQHVGCKFRRQECALNVLHICRRVKSLVYCVVSCVGKCSSDVTLTLEVPFSLWLQY